MKGKVIAIVAAIILAIAGGTAWLMHMENYDEFCYVEVHDPQVAEMPGDLRYKYTMETWTEKGKQKKLTFKTAAPLENGQILKLEVRAAGVYHYNFIDENQIPEEIRDKVLQN